MQKSKIQQLDLNGYNISNLRVDPKITIKVLIPSRLPTDNKKSSMEKLRKEISIQPCH
jgi:hypothetical protein